MIEILIIEDEIPAQRLLKETLKEISINTEVITCLNSIKSAVNWLQNNKHPEIILLDIQLSDGLSFEIFKQVEVNSQIIFTTAYDEYAIQAFKVNSLDYLLKPIEEEELEMALNKFQKHQSNSVQERTAIVDYEKLASIIGNKQKEYRKRFLIQSNDSFLKVSVNEIAYFYSMQGVTFAVTFEKREYPVNFSLENLKEQLDPDYFFKLNRQIIININSIKRVHSYFNGKLKLETDPVHNEDMIIGKDKAALFKRWLDR
ncbi:LytR/AlgR family response regulator transcription factor [Tenacibaculum xiamenense]|uniref:LytR/AlgR family response regulator transcription factor n=1 Tax=Tenacibaculum xiamenense TaxID=1261553 RepID=UPI003895B19E